MTNPETSPPAPSQEGAQGPHTLDELNKLAESAAEWIVRGVPTWMIKGRTALRLMDAAKSMHAWRDYAEHLEHCVECSQSSWRNCWDGGQLRALARGIPND